MSSSAVRPLAGLGMVIAIAAIVVFSIGMFRGGFGTTVPVTVVSERAGLVMNPEAKVKLLGVQVGTVTSIEYALTPDDEEGAWLVQAMWAGAYDCSAVDVHGVAW